MKRPDLLQRRYLLKKLIDAESDQAVLELVGKVLERRTKGIALTSDLVERIIRSNKDLQDGRSMDRDHFLRSSDEFIKELYKHGAEQNEIDRSGGGNAQLSTDAAASGEAISKEFHDPDASTFQGTEVS